MHRLNRYVARRRTRSDLYALGATYELLACAPADAVERH
jgi:hypothetical protein